MADPKIFFHSNIKFLRERKKISQESFAQLVDIKRVTLQALESGRIKNPTAIDLLKFSDQFKLSIDALMRTDLPKLGELKLRELENGSDVFMTGSQLRVLAITVDKNNKENVEYVPVKAKAGYSSGYNDPDYISALPKFNFPTLPKVGTFRMFPITGDSMLPIPNGSDIMARYIEDWKLIKPRTACILILNNVTDFVFKLATINEDRTFTLESLNPLYKPYTVRSAEVLEVWQFYSYHTKELPEPAADLQHISGSIQEILSEIKFIKSKV